MNRDAQALSHLLDFPVSPEPRAARLLRHVGGVGRLSRWSAAELARTALVTVREAERIHAAFTLGVLGLCAPAGQPLDSPARVAAALPELWRADVEEVWSIAVDSGLRVITRRCVARGRRSACDVLPAQALRPVVAVGADALILAHNHPGGDPQPSAADLAFTRLVQRSAERLGIQLIDHVVIAGPRWASCVHGDVGEAPRARDTSASDLTRRP